MWEAICAEREEEVEEVSVLLTEQTHRIYSTDTGDTKQNFRFSNKNLIQHFSLSHTHTQNPVGPVLFPLLPIYSTYSFIKTPQS